MFVALLLMSSGFVFYYDVFIVSVACVVVIVIVVVLRRVVVIFIVLVILMLLLSLSLWTFLVSCCFCYGYRYGRCYCFCGSRYRCYCFVVVIFFRLPARGLYHHGSGRPPVDFALVQTPCVRCSSSSLDASGVHRDVQCHLGLLRKGFVLIARTLDRNARHDRRHNKKEKFP